MDALATGRGYPAAAVAACLRQPGQVVPVLQALLQRAARGLTLSEAEASQLFLGLHILAKLRHEPSCAPLLRLLRQPSDKVEYLLGDVVTTTLPKIVASVFDGEAEVLFDMIADAAIDQYVRDALWRGAVALTRQGRIAREAIADFIVRFDDERLAPADDMGWYGWLQAIADLGLQALAPRVRPLWTDGRLPDNILMPSDFNDDLAAALEGGPASAEADMIDDIAADLAWADWGGPPEPIVNPMRHVGRNDPCPCGSGKKAKKCCLATA